MLSGGNSHHLRGVCHHCDRAWWSNPRAARPWAPSLQRQAGLQFNVFSVSTLSALCFSSISLVMFLNNLTSPYQDTDIGNYLANKLILALGFLFISIMPMFLSFSGDLFVLDSKMKRLALNARVTASERSQLEDRSSSADGSLQSHDRACSSSTRQDRSSEGAAIADKGNEP
ncbi:hypothetical protein MRB53_003545 [Persea americana]|uniref:Uncharacterized protein n=1 Tax=Persea americana TaxID=3435 RepID=A0ACC2N0T6_PERAE|nr:hypothetical protein MRB53_003545 [Persea americana]